MSSDGDSGSGPAPAAARLSLWLWLLILQMAVWRPIADSYFDRQDLQRILYASFADPYFSDIEYTVLRFAGTVLLFLAAISLVFYRRRPAIWLMIFALWSVIPLEWLRRWSLGMLDPSLPPWTGWVWLSTISIVFFPVGWTAYLLESTVVAACFPADGKAIPRKSAGFASFTRTIGRRLNGLLPVRMRELGPWLGIVIVHGTVWHSVQLAYLLQRHGLWRDLLQVHDTALLARRWLVFIAMACLALEFAAAMLLLLRRRHASILLTINAMWLLFLLGVGNDANGGWLQLFSSKMGNTLFQETGYLFWPIAWTAYLLESSRVARLYPRAEEAGLASGGIDVF